jgi:AraC-like DNA-binding protein
MGRPRHHVVFLGSSGVSYEELPPPPALRPWVAVLWRLHAHVAHDLRVLPDGCMDLIGDDVVGSLSAPVVGHLRPGEVTHGVRFHPGGFPALFGVPASELVDARLPIRDVRRDVRSLLDLARDADQPDPLARAAYRAHEVGMLARDTGYSERQLRRRVLQATGHSPKRLMRIGRMQRVLRCGRGESWARTAAEHGYYDEAHLANDVSDLAGATPHQLLA